MGSGRAWRWLRAQQQIQRGADCCCESAPESEGGNCGKRESQQRGQSAGSGRLGKRRRSAGHAVAGGAGAPAARHGESGTGRTHARGGGADPRGASAVRASSAGWGLDRPRCSRRLPRLRGDASAHASQAPVNDRRLGLGRRGGPPEDQRPVCAAALQRVHGRLGRCQELGGRDAAQDSPSRAAGDAARATRPALPRVVARQGQDDLPFARDPGDGGDRRRDRRRESAVQPRGGHALDGDQHHGGGRLSPAAGGKQAWDSDSPRSVILGARVRRGAGQEAGFEAPGRHHVAAPLSDAAGGRCREHGECFERRRH
mmetsp:Transcript_250/g.1051  ORF Transcript_250/g.1051 Transcript_250/m.1051 type:complete len:314 (+) Transcript_250:329-1270(+)